MDVSEIVATVLSVIGALGGLELIKWWFTRKENRRAADAKADIAEVEAETAEFRLLREHLEMVDKQLIEKEARLQQQTELVRELNRKLLDCVNEIGALTSRITALEYEREMKYCGRDDCKDRIFCKRS
jgi:hypothetical protein